MKKLMTVILVLSFTLLLSGCGEWDDLVDSVSGSDDDDTTTTTTTTAPRKDVSDTKTKTTSTDTKTKTSTDTSTDSTFKNKATYTATGVMSADRGGGTTFRINKNGTAFGKSIKVVFSNGWTATISDTSKRYSKSGFIYRPGTGSIASGTGTSHGGVFICANSGNKSKSLTVYY